MKTDLRYAGKQDEIAPSSGETLGASAAIR
jgi:hypothetical protein